MWALSTKEEQRANDETLGEKTKAEARMYTKGNGEEAKRQEVERKEEIMHTTLTIHCPCLLRRGQPEVSPPVCSQALEHVFRSKSCFPNTVKTDIRTSRSLFEQEPVVFQDMEPTISVPAAIRSGMAGRRRGGQTQTKSRLPSSRQSRFESCLSRSDEERAKFFSCCFGYGPCTESVAV
jgi:hypothetical protein